MKKMLAIFALLMVVFSSGCTVPGLDIEIPGVPDIFGTGMSVSEERHDVIVIDEMSANPRTTVPVGQSTDLRVVAKNLQTPGNTPVEVEIGLYDYCGMFDVDGKYCSGSITGKAKPDWDDPLKKKL